VVTHYEKTDHTALLNSYDNQLLVKVKRTLVGSWGGILC